MSISRGTVFENKRTGRSRTFSGYTTKPAPDQPSDGVRRVRLVAPDGTETRPTLVGLERAYKPVA